MSTFSHPLGKQVMIWQTAGIEEKGSRVLVVVTALQLDEKHESYNAQELKRLSEAAKSWISENKSEADDFILINSPDTC